MPLRDNETRGAQGGAEAQAVRACGPTLDARAESSHDLGAALAAIRKSLALPVEVESADEPLECPGYGHGV